MEKDLKTILKDNLRDIMKNDSEGEHHFNVDGHEYKLKVMKTKRLGYRRRMLNNADIRLIMDNELIFILSVGDPFLDRGIKKNGWKDKMVEFMHKDIMEQMKEVCGND